MNDITILAPIYEGKAKVVFATPDPELLVLHFKDDATAFNRQKVGTIAGKGPINLRVAVRLMRELEAAGIATHVVRVLDERRLLVRKVAIIPLEIVVRNRTAGTFSKRYAVEEGIALAAPLVELFWKDDAHGDPLVNDAAAVLLGFATAAEVTAIQVLALRVNTVLRAFFAARGIELVDFKIEAGRAADGALLLADEISADSCRLWEIGTGRKLDKDRFRRDLGDIEATYAEVLARVEAVPA
ncbi:MAG: phosphoribosylaminoimidazolesuccinocarboxamide synthase [Myxococcales bacterium]|nr:phosphoribosylaminoimidazolesuccinocarboxamide synthase [Myxococcales bacterium]